MITSRVQPLEKIWKSASGMSAVLERAIPAERTLTGSRFRSTTACRIRAGTDSPLVS